MRFQARVFDPARAVAADVVRDAPSENELREHLVADGMVVLDVRPERRLVFNRAQAGHGGIRIFCIEVAALLRAGLSLPEAIGSLAVRAQNADAALHRQLHERLMAGARFSDALEQASARFPAILVAAVRASERTSRVADALEEFARYDEAIDALRRRAINAAVYPAMVVGFGLLVSLFLLGYVVPRFARIYESTSATASVATRLLLKVGSLIDGHRLLIGLALLAVAGFVVWICSKSEFRARAAIVLTRAGPLRRIARGYQLARITQALAMLLRGGYPLPDAMRLARALAVRPDLAKGLDAALVEVTEGRLLSQAWGAQGLGGEFDRRLLQAGERTGELGTIFDAISQAYSRDVETAMERASRLIEPAMLMAVALVIGLIVVLMYMPIFDLAGTLQ
jgi:general secretion pathway protein F